MNVNFSQITLEQIKKIIYKYRTLKTSTNKNDPTQNASKQISFPSSDSTEIRPDDATVARVLRRMMPRSTLKTMRGHRHLLSSSSDDSSPGFATASDGSSSDSSVEAPFGRPRPPLPARSYGRPLPPGSRPPRPLPIGPRPPYSSEVGRRPIPALPAPPITPGANLNVGVIRKPSHYEKLKTKIRDTEDLSTKPMTSTQAEYLARLRADKLAKELSSYYKNRKRIPPAADIFDMVVPGKQLSIKSPKITELPHSEEEDVSTEFKRNLDAASKAIQDATSSKNPNALAELEKIPPTKPLPVADVDESFRKMVTSDATVPTASVGTTTTIDQGTTAPTQDSTTSTQSNQPKSAQDKLLEEVAQSLANLTDTTKNESFKWLNTLIEESDDDDPNEIADALTGDVGGESTANVVPQSIPLNETSVDIKPGINDVDYSEYKDKLDPTQIEYFKKQLISKKLYKDDPIPEEQPPQSSQPERPEIKININNPSQSSLTSDYVSTELVTPSIFPKINNPPMYSKITQAQQDAFDKFMIPFYEETKKAKPNFTELMASQPDIDEEKLDKIYAVKEEPKEVVHSSDIPDHITMKNMIARLPEIYAQEEAAVKLNAELVQVNKLMDAWTIAATAYQKDSTQPKPDDFIREKINDSGPYRIMNFEYDKWRSELANERVTNYTEFFKEKIATIHQSLSTLNLIDEENYKNFHAGLKSAYGILKYAHNVATHSNTINGKGIYYRKSHYKKIGFGIGNPEIPPGTPTNNKELKYAKNFATRYFIDRGFNTGRQFAESRLGTDDPAEILAVAHDIIKKNGELSVAYMIWTAIRDEINQSREQFTQTPPIGGIVSETGQKGATLRLIQQATTSQTVNTVDLLIPRYDYRSPRIDELAVQQTSQNVIATQTLLEDIQNRLTELETLRNSARSITYHIGSISINSNNTYRNRTTVGNNQLALPGERGLDLLDAEISDNDDSDDGRADVRQRRQLLRATRRTITSLIISLIQVLGTKVGNMLVFAAILNWWYGWYVLPYVERGYEMAGNASEAFGNFTTNMNYRMGNFTESVNNRLGNISESISNAGEAVVNTANIPIEAINSARRFMLQPNSPNSFSSYINDLLANTSRLGSTRNVTETRPSLLFRDTNFQGSHPVPSSSNRQRHLAITDPGNLYASNYRADTPYTPGATMPRNPRSLDMRISPLNENNEQYYNVVNNVLRMGYSAASNAVRHLLYDTPVFRNWFYDEGDRQPSRYSQSTSNTAIAHPDIFKGQGIPIHPAFKVFHKFHRQREHINLNRDHDMIINSIYSKKHDEAIIRQTEKRTAEKNLPVLNYNENYVKASDYNPNNPNIALEEIEMAPIITNPYTAQSSCAIQRYTNASGTNKNLALPWLSEAYISKPLVINRRHVTNEYMTERIKQDTANMLRYTKKDINSKVDAIEHLRGTLGLMDATGGMYKGTLRDFFAKRLGAYTGAPGLGPRPVVFDPLAHPPPRPVVPPDLGAFAPDYVPPAIANSTFPISTAGRQNPPNVRDRLRLNRYNFLRPAYRPLTLEQYQALTPRDVHFYPPLPRNYYDIAQPPHPVLPAGRRPAPPGMARRLFDAAYDFLAGIPLPGFPAPRPRPPPTPVATPYATPLGSPTGPPPPPIGGRGIDKVQPEHLDDYHMARDLEKPSSSSYSLALSKAIKKGLGLGIHPKEIIEMAPSTSIDHGKVMAKLAYNKPLEKPLDTDVGKGIECEHCQSRSDLKHYSNTSYGGFICSSCHVGKGMTKNREPLEHFNVEDVSESNPKTSHFHEALVKHKYNESLANMEIDNSWDHFIKTAPKSISANFGEHASSNFVAFGNYDEHMLDLLTYLIGYISMAIDNNKSLPKMLMYNLYALTGKLWEHEGTKGDEFDYDALKDFHSLKTYIKLNPGSLSDLVYHK